MNDIAHLQVDPARMNYPDSGYYVRAYRDGKIGTYDIVNLTRDSLFAWLRSRGGENEWAESVIFGLFGHEQPKTSLI